MTRIELGKAVIVYTVGWSNDAEVLERSPQSPEANGGSAPDQSP